MSSQPPFPPYGGPQDSFGTPPPPRGMGIPAMSQGIPGPPPSGSPSPGKQARKKPPKRSVSSVRNLLVVLLLVLVASVAVIVLNPKHTYVAVFSRSLPAGTPIGSSDLTTAAIRGKAPAAAFSASSASAALAEAEQATAGKFTARSVRATRAILSTEISTASAATSSLGPTQRLISVSANAPTAVGGTITAGSYVDIISTPTSASATGGPVTIVAQHVKVISAEPLTNYVPSPQQAQTTSTKKASSTTATTQPATATTKGVYILVVTAKLVPSVALADDTTNLYLAYEAPTARPMRTGNTQLTLSQALALAAGAKS